MQLILKGRGVELNDRLREYASTKLTRTQRFFERIIKLEAELFEEGNPRGKSHYRCEVVVKTPVQTLRAQGAGADYFAAIDQAADRLERQVKRVKDRLTAHPHRTDNHQLGRLEAEPTDADDGPRIVRTIQTLVKPMPPDEAVLQLEAQGMQFLMFTNAETMAPNVIYRRVDGAYGLIEPRSDRR